MENKEIYSVGWDDGVFDEVETCFGNQVETQQSATTVEIKIQGDDVERGQ